MQETLYDIVIIGAGINGTGVAREAAWRGLKVLLIDKGDIASGTSSKSSKLIHGGLRYLENLEFKLIYEASRERRRLLETAPHLVKPLPFILPIYKRHTKNKYWMDLGLTLYDLLALFKNMRPHCMLNAQEVLERQPRLKPENLEGGALFYDAQVRDDARLCLDNWLCAKEKGADCLTYYRVSQITAAKEGFQLNVESTQGSDKRTFSARSIVNATGPWSDLVTKLILPQAKNRLRLSKGVHVVVPAMTGAEALLLTAAKDKRVFFVLPWFGNTLIGTTDTDFHGHPDQVSADHQDIQYLLEETQGLMKSVRLRPTDCLTTTASLRPLLQSQGSVGKASREHQIAEDVPGFFSIAGGKLTTYQLIARQTVDRVLGRLKIKAKPSPRNEPLARILRRDWESFHTEMVSKLSGEYRIAPRLAGTLVNRYGGRTTDFVELLQKDPGLAKPLHPSCDLLAAEVAYAFEKEEAKTVDDVIARRTALIYRFPLRYLDREPFVEPLARYGKLSAEEVRAQWNALRAF